MKNNFCEYCGLADNITERCTKAETELAQANQRIRELEAENLRLFNIKLDAAIEHPCYQTSKKFEALSNKYREAIQQARNEVSYLEKNNILSRALENE